MPNIFWLMAGCQEADIRFFNYRIFDIMKCLIAKKIGMTTLYTEGMADNVTLLEVLPNEVLATRTFEKDGYSAVQVGLLMKQGASKTDEKKPKKAQYELVCEFRTEQAEKEFEKGKKLTVEQFEKGQKVFVQGITKGKGYQGVVKRHGFKGSPASHGHRHDLRAPGSIGSAFPEHVLKGKKMAGRMGGAKKTMMNLSVSHIDPAKNILALKGSIPGSAGSVVRVYSR